jgi:V/A-type H+/Na+-transporting ATPase subunit E
MAEELQHLIDKIHAEAIKKADDEAAQIESKAKEKAAALVKEAEQKAKDIIAKAEKDAEQYTERSTRTLEQVARDLLITVGQGVENILDDLVKESLDEALDIQVVKKMLERMVETYMARGGKERRIALLVNPDEQEELIKFYAGRYREKLKGTLEIKPDDHVIKGFRVSFVDEHAHHDFTKEAIAEALSKFLRPHLSEIILRVAREEKKGS